VAEATLHFPRDFRWGTATAAHQVEGDNTNNDWWIWEQTPGRIRDGASAGLACNWWAQAEADFDRAAAMGQNALRLSVEWSRIEPEAGQWDDAALDRYRQMLRELRRRNIEPMVTLHHFTNPLWLLLEGGWASSNVVQHFERYVRKVVEALGEYTDLWCTVNEPVIYALLGYIDGRWPPGKRNIGLAFEVLTNFVRAHAVAYDAIHEAQAGARVGVAHNMRLFDPARPRSPLDRRIAAVQDRLFNVAFLDALLTGRLWFPFGRSRRIPKAAGTLDFIGLNYYTRDLVAFDPRYARRIFGRSFPTAGAAVGDGNYGEIYPEGIFRCLQRLVPTRLPIYITENGLPDADDSRRSRFLLAHLRQVWRAINLNWPVMGYYHWTLVDNFEWADGWSLRFGLFELDTETQVRTLRPSGRLYAEICRTNTITSDMAARYAPESKDELFPG
jgi:beta-glucosidase